MYLRLSDARVTMIFLRNCQKTTEYKYVLAYVLATNRNSHWSHHYIIILIPPTFQQPKKNSDPTPLIFFCTCWQGSSSLPFFGRFKPKTPSKPLAFCKVACASPWFFKACSAASARAHSACLPQGKEPWEFPCICRDRVYVLCKKNCVEK